MDRKSGNAVNILAAKSQKSPASRGKIDTIQQANLVIDRNIQYSGELRRAQKEYRCGVIQDIGCARTILIDDVYFCLTEKKGETFRTYRYCLDCAQELHSDLVGLSTRDIKSEAKQRAVGVQFKRAAFAKLQSTRLRRRPTPPERFLWTFLKDKKLGLTFFRQKILQGFVVDFWCPELKLVLELDGRHHFSQKQKDSERDNLLSQHGITVLRFPAAIVYSDVTAILEKIRWFQSQRL